MAAMASFSMALNFYTDGKTLYPRYSYHVKLASLYYSLLGAVDYEAGVLFPLHPSIDYRSIRP